MRTGLSVFRSRRWQLPGCSRYSLQILSQTACENSQRQPSKRAKKVVPYLCTSTHWVKGPTSTTRTPPPKAYQHMWVSVNLKATDQWKPKWPIGEFIRFSQFVVPHHGWDHEQKNRHQCTRHLAFRLFFVPITEQSCGKKWSSCLTSCDLSQTFVQQSKHLTFHQFVLTNIYIKC